jgi:tRNA/rRNA methyltransferase
VQRLAIELINPGETELIAKDRATRREWLQSRGYRVIDMLSAAIEADLVGELDRLEAGIQQGR